MFILMILLIVFIIYDFEIDFCNILLFDDFLFV
jgi:hypothetical protein